MRPRSLTSAPRRHCQTLGTGAQSRRRATDFAAATVGALVVAVVVVVPGHWPAPAVADSVAVPANHAAEAEAVVHPAGANLRQVLAVIRAVGARVTGRHGDGPQHSTRVRVYANRSLRGKPAAARR